MKLTLEKINKFVLLLALIALVYRKGNFSATHIPKPFELIFIILLVLTAIYILFEKNIKHFFTSIPKNILWATGVLIFSVILGWTVGAKLAGIPTTLLTVLEFGTFGIGIAAFLMILFYTKNDDKYAKWYLYALLLPNFYLVYYLSSRGLAPYFGIVNDGFFDFTLNPNVLSKILLIPSLFFVSKSLYDFRNKNWLAMIWSILLSAVFVAIVFWTLSRAAALSVVLASVCAWLVFSFVRFDWKKLFGGAVVVAVILSVGFTIVPKISKNGVVTKITETVNTVSNLDEDKSAYVARTPEKFDYVYEPRLVVWSFFPKYAWEHPLGVGPATHADFGVYDGGGKHIIIGPDNTYLQIWVFGGLLGIGSFLYLLFTAFKNLFLRLKRDFDRDTFALLGILFALSVAIFFDGSLALYWFFIILALAIQKNGKSEDKHPSTNV